MLIITLWVSGVGNNPEDFVKRPHEREGAGRKLIRTSLWILRYMVKKALANGLLVSNKYGVVICAPIKTTVQSLKEWDLISFKNRAAETSHDNRYDMNGGTKRKRRFRTKKTKLKLYLYPRIMG